MYIYNHILLYFNLMAVDYQWLLSRFLCIRYLLISLIDFHHRTLFCHLLIHTGRFLAIFLYQILPYSVYFRPEDERCTSFPFVDRSHWFSLTLSFAIYAHWEISKDFGLFEILLYLQPTYISGNLKPDSSNKVWLEQNLAISFMCDCTQSYSWSSQYVFLQF